MKHFLFFIPFFLAVASITECTANSSPLASFIQTRVKRHSGEIDNFKSLTRSKQSELNDVINRWAHMGATPRDNAGTLYNQASSRIDLQGTYNFEGRRFHRYAVQQGSGTYAVVHIETGVKFGVGLIRGSFEQSRNHRAHVFLAQERVRVRPPTDGKRYEPRVITRRWNRATNKAVVWSTRAVTDALARKFDRKNFS